MSRYYRQHLPNRSEFGTAFFAINVPISYTEQLVAIIKATLMAASGFTHLAILDQFILVLVRSVKPKNIDSFAK